MDNKLCVHNMCTSCHDVYHNVHHGDDMISYRLNHLTETIELFEHAGSPFSHWTESATAEQGQTVNLSDSKLALWLASTALHGYICTASLPMHETSY